MATLYWHNLNATNDANDRTNYSTDQAGTVPAASGSLASDNLRFDGTGSGADDDWTLSANLTCLSLNFTDYTGTATIGNYTAVANGSITLVSGMTLSIGASGWLAMGANGTLTAPIAIARFQVVGAITCTLSGTVQIDYLNTTADGAALSGGTLGLNGTADFDGNATVSAAISLLSDLSLDVAAGKLVTFSGTTGGSYNITKIGSGEARWSPNAPSHVNTNITAGYVTFQPGGTGTFSFGSGTVTISNNATWWIRPPGAAVTMSNPWVVESTGGKLEVTPVNVGSTGWSVTTSGTLTVRGDVELVCQNLTANVTSDVWIQTGVIYIETTSSVSFKLTVGNSTATSMPRFTFQGSMVESSVPAYIRFYLYANRRIWCSTATWSLTAPVIIESNSTSNKYFLCGSASCLGCTDVTIKTNSVLNIPAPYGSYGVIVRSLTIEGTGYITWGGTDPGVECRGNLTISSSAGDISGGVFNCLPVTTPVSVNFGGKTIRAWRFGLGSSGDKVINVTGSFSTARGGDDIRGLRTGKTGECKVVLSDGVNILCGSSTGNKGAWSTVTGSGSERFVIDASASSTIRFRHRCYLGSDYYVVGSGLTLRWLSNSADAASRVNIPAGELYRLLFQPDVSGQRFDIYTTQNVWTQPGELSTQITSLYLNGVRIANSDKGRLYWDLVDASGTRTFSIYKDSAKTQLVAQYSGPGGTGVVISEVGGSGISGTCNLTYSADDTDSGNIIDGAAYVSNMFVMDCNGAATQQHIWNTRVNCNVLMPTGSTMSVRQTSGTTVIVGGSFDIAGYLQLHPSALYGASIFYFSRESGTQTLSSYVSLPVVSGDSANQLSNWSLTGIYPFNTDNGYLYWELYDVSGIRTVNLYSDAAKTVLVASGSRAGDGVLILSPVGSTVSGQVTVAYTANDTDSDNYLMCMICREQTTFHTPGWDFTYQNWQLRRVSNAYSDYGRLYWDMEVINTQPLSVRFRGYMDSARTVLVVEGTYDIGGDFQGVINGTASVSGVGASPTYGTVAISSGSNFLEYGDSANQLDSWWFSSNQNTGWGGTLYWDLVVSGGIATVSLYSDAAKTNLVSRGSTPTGTADTYISLVQQGGSGINGVVKLVPASPVSDTDGYNRVRATGKGMSVSGDTRISESGDTGNNLSSWSISGINPANTDRYKLYWRYIRSGTTITVELYADSARTILVSRGSRTGAGSISLSAQNSMGVSGSVSVTDYGSDIIIDGAIQYGDLQDLAVTGIVKSLTTNGTVYWRLNYSGGNVTYSLYQDSSRTVMIATSGAVAYTGTEQVLTLNEVGGSGVSGTVKLVGLTAPASGNTDGSYSGFLDQRVTYTGLLMYHYGSGTLQINDNITGILHYHQTAGNLNLNGKSFTSGACITLDGGTVSNLGNGCLKAGTRFTANNIALVDNANTWYLVVEGEAFVSGGSAQNSDASHGITINAPSTIDLGGNINWVFGGTGIAKRSFCVTS